MNENGRPAHCGPAVLVWRTALLLGAGLQLALRGLCPTARRCKPSRLGTEVPPATSRPARGGGGPAVAGGQAGHAGN